MKTSKYIFLSMAAVVLAVACKEELNPDNPIKANPGDEVQFGAALPGKTKTVYGEEIANEDGTNPRFPIYWVNGDLVKVASPQCMNGRNSAEYSVAVESATQNYATSLTKTGEVGIQWGEAATADFYSIYPSTAGTELTVSGENVVAKLHVDATQFASTKDLGTSYYAQPAEMGNVIMYAKTMGVNRNDPKTKGVVELHYTPFSTVLEFEINASTEEVAGKQKTITVQSLTLTAPTGTIIAGDFSFNFPTGEGSPSIEAATGGSNTITMHFLANNQYATVLSLTQPKLKAKMCLMPISGVESLAGWTVEVNTSAGAFIKVLKEQDFVNKDGTPKNTALAPGKVHKIILPTLNYASKEWDYDPANWIPSLPDYRNIYLSEISLPGAWYACSTEGVAEGTGYQATSSIEELWNKGVRAFAVETKVVSTTSSTAASWNGVPEGIVISGSGQNTSNVNGYRMGANSLNGDPTSTTQGQQVYYNGTSISSVFTSIIDQIKLKPNEYAVLVLSYADGGRSGLRYVDFGYWLQGIYDIYNALTDDYKPYIYSEEINANTIVDKVRGKLILKINIDANIAMKGYLRVRTGYLWEDKYEDRVYSYENNLPALFSYNPFLLQMGEEVDFTSPHYSNLSWKNWGDGSYYRSFDLVSNLQGSSGSSDRFIWVFSSANRTQLDTGTDTSIPKYQQRQAALGSMMNFSNQIYQASTHNVWFYFNCGGTQAESSTSDSNLSPTAFATVMNEWLLGKINAKTDASPLGIVMFNQCTSDTYKGPAIVKAIIEMNSKFYLKHAGTSGGSTGGTVDNTAPNDATVQDGGNAI
ncbi:MAG: hypothetical protein ACI3Y9_07685 [Candidatus Cryptobacteroides sp.]